MSSDLPVPSDAPSTPEDPLIKLWELPIPEPIAIDPASPMVPDAPLPTASAPSPVIPAALGNDYRRNPLARTALSNARSNAASFTDGVGGIGSLADSAFLPARMNSGGRGFVLGPATIHPSASLGVNYQKSGGGNAGDDDGLHPTAGLSFNLVMGLPESRRTLAMDYSAAYLFGQDNSDARPFTQQLGLRANWGFTKLELGLGISFSGLSGENRDIGGQSNQDLFTVALTSTYEFTPKTSVDLDLTLPIRSYSAGADSSEMTATSFLNYQYSPKTTVGLGVAAGLTDVQEENGASNQDAQHYVQVLARASTAASEVFSFAATLGAGLLEAGDSQKITPVFGLGATWTPRLGTAFSLTADRRPQNSASNTSQNFITTSVALSVTQRVGSRMRLQLSGGYENAAYYSIDNTSASVSGSNSEGVFTNARDASGEERHDQLFVGQIGLAVELHRQWTAQLQYSYRKNSSNTNGFDDSRAQFQINFAF